MRVGILHYTSPPIIGGVEQLMAIHARLLREDGHEPIAIAGRGGPFDRSARMRRIPLLDSKHPAIVEAGAALATGAVPSEFEALVSTLVGSLQEACGDLDACIVHNAMTLHFNLPLTAALHQVAPRMPNTRFIAWCHDLAWTNPLYLPVLHDGWPWDLLRTAAPDMRYVVVSEERQRELTGLTGLPPEKFDAVPAGIDPSQKLVLRASTVRLLERLGLFRANPFLLLPVRITRRKNIEYAIRVVAHLRDDCGLAPRLVVTGPPGPHNVRSGDYVAELLDLREQLGVVEEVQFLFEERSDDNRPLRVGNRMMDELYRTADLLLFPSSQEGFGIPMLEAGVVRLPAFCSDIPPFREIAGESANFFQLSDPPLRTAARVAEFCRQDAPYLLRKRVLAHATWERLYEERIKPLLAPAPVEVVV